LRIDTGISSNKTDRADTSKAIPKLPPHPMMAKTTRIRSAYGGIKQPERNIKAICNNQFDTQTYYEAGVLKNKLAYMTVLKQAPS
jgi:hypothetical protein